MSCDPTTNAVGNPLFKDDEKTVFLLDIPRSIEEAQDFPGQPLTGHRLVSAEPVSEPYPTPEPKDADSRRHEQLPSALLADLMTEEASRHALEVVHEAYTGPLCLPRVTERHEAKSKPAQDENGDSKEQKPAALHPPGSSFIHDTIEGGRDEFRSKAPTFDLIVLDPPWPNRSAKRKRSGGYATLSGLPETRALLSQIPIPSHLTPQGLVAIWVTNKPSIIDLLTDPRDGILSEWGLEVAAEWTWLKITSKGEPLYALDSTWRKPWERLIVARRKGAQVHVPQNRVVLAVPDLHSRKPHLRCVFEDVVPDQCRGLEVFARSLTAGWWSWGNEVLRFQGEEHWVMLDETKGGEENPPT